MAAFPKFCPSCSSRLVVTQLGCPNCGTKVQGEFDPDLFSRLSPGDFDFLVMFIKNKGNVKDMERELGISYWTIRSKLNEVVERLGLESSPTPPESAGQVDQRQAILEQLNQGKLTVQQAAEQLDQLKRKSRRG